MGTTARKPKKTRAERPDGWDSAFFRFAEAVRELTGGAANYKLVYALVGTNGRYVNHVSPIVRKRTAAALSRLMHSSRYAQDLRESYRQDTAVFSNAAASLAQTVREASGLTDAQAFERFSGHIWAELCAGLKSEYAGGREVNLARVARESAALSSWSTSELACGRAPLEDLIAASLHMMAFGCLDEGFARSLCARTPDVPAGEAPAPAPSRPREDAACLIRVADERDAPVSGIWRVSAAQPFSIGRYTDCDAIEVEPLVSRLHCRIYRFDGAWYVEDPGSAHGTRVVRGQDPETSRTVFRAGGTRSPGTFELLFGDRIVLAGRSTYWFRALDECELT